MTDDNAQLIGQKISDLRQRLLDFSRRNPLIHTNFGSRGINHIRAVDELPAILMYKLQNGEELRFAPLPPLETPLPDEETEAFRQAVNTARLTDSDYLGAIEKLQDEDTAQLSAREHALRNLKDKVREDLGLPKRQSKIKTDLVAHATAHGITPSYDLPHPNDRHEDGRHEDDEIQTLILPEPLARNLGRIAEKNRTFEEETGISVLRAAFGYLDWKDPKSSSRTVSPLLLLPVSLRREKTASGPVFYVSATEDTPELNHVLTEMLRLQFNIELPSFENVGVEEYLELLAEAPSNELDWKIRRMAVFGIYPSSRIAMYNDLDPETWDFSTHKGISSLLVGSEGSGLDTAVDYEIDEPDIENQIDALIDRADVSQFSALVDIASGRNLAIEGPPGTGKSQTIVNAIADAIAKGKSVLFIAEKSAALSVVQNKLRAAGLGPFTLSMIAGKATKRSFMESVNERLNTQERQVPGNRDQTRKRFSDARDRMKAYTSVLAKPVGDTGKTVHDMLGAAMRTSAALDDVPRDIINQITQLDPYAAWADLDSLKAASDEYEAAIAALCEQTLWRESSLTALSVFQWTDIKASLDTTIDSLDTVCALRRDLLGEDAGDCEWSKLTHQQAAEIAEAFVTLLEDEPQLSVDAGAIATDEISALVGVLEELVQNRQLLENLATNPEDEVLGSRLASLAAAMERLGVDTPTVESAEAGLSAMRSKLTEDLAAARAIAALVKTYPNAKRWRIHDFCAVRSAVDDVSDDALLMREVAWSSPAAANVLADLSRALSELSELRGRVEQVFSNAEAVDAEDLMTMINAISQAGIFSFASAGFRSAKARYAALSRTGRFDKANALPHLQEWLTLKRKQRELDGDGRYTALLGPLFAGSRTRKATIDEILAFKKNVTTRYASRPDFIDCLKSAPAAAMRDLPLEMDSSNDAVTQWVGSLQSRHKTDAQVDDQLVAVKLGVPFLRTPAAINLEQVRQLRDAATRRDALSAELRAHPSAKLVFGDQTFLDAKSAHRALEIAKLLSQATVSTTMSSIFGRQLTAGIVEDINANLRALDDAQNSLKRSWEEFAEKSGLVGRVELDLSQTTEFLSVCREAANDQDSLQRTVQANRALQTLARHQFAGLASVSSDTSSLKARVEAAIYRVFAVLADTQNSGLLSQFDGVTLDQARADIARLDECLNTLDRQHVRTRVISRTRDVPIGNGLGKVATYTEFSLLDHYRDKQRIRPSLRDFVNRAGRALQTLKPCWMMSPLAVAQYVPMGAVRFDLCIIDEASQMTPESAIGAIMRSKQVVVVGDENQLPPTSFFRKALLDDANYDDDDETEAVEEKSILEMANATFRPKRQLNWHYRSRHGSLISFSNRFVYDDKLTVFPSPHEDGNAFRAVSLRHTHGLYHKGLNDIEAKAVADAAVEHMRLHPDRSLGIVALNLAQASLIEQFMEEKRNTHTHVEDYWQYWLERDGGLERFFVKNLENVQGDERDTIFISTVYGPEAEGAKVHQRFGPISGAPGRRRLNVLFSRAKHEMITFTSMAPGDILAAEEANIGAFMLKRWLEFAGGGQLPMLTSGHDREPDSDFERHVIDVITKLGYTAVAQVGAAGYFIDIGVKHPEWGNGFVLGVECDGAAYHSSKSARDRDRLRQEVLEGLGWRIHRIWSTDWFNNQSRETALLQEAIEEAYQYWRDSAAIAVDAQETVPISEADGPDQLFLGFNQDAETAIETIEPKPVIASPHPTASTRSQAEIVDVGTRVRIRFFDDPSDHREFVIAHDANNLDENIVAKTKPLAKAVMELEVGDEFELNAGTKLRRGVIEAVSQA